MNTYGKVTKLDLSKWIITRFYKYTSTVREWIASYETMFDKRGDEYIKELYDHFVRIANIYYNGFTKRSLGLEDNKTVIEITNIETGDKLYIGQYDGNYRLGLDVWTEFGDYYDFHADGSKKDYDKMK